MFKRGGKMTWAEKEWAEKEVPSLELCKRLKELGFPQDGGEGWYWREGKIKPVLGLLIDKSDLGWTLLECVDGIWAKSPYLYGEELKKLIKAPTCRELGEWLLKVYLKLPTGHPVRNKLISFCLPLKLNPNILSKDLIWLAENGYVKFKDFNK
ncbi:MAG: hypothetical protein B6D55_04640 [Candidatus Omnitrophica bacterium 4484_70.2]|nr:MAG: hypothetical protein B6D55_04640 [Candidatus Omnitrophica bacterium 4484_70.2]